MSIELGFDGFPMHAENERQVLQHIKPIQRKPRAVREKDVEADHRDAVKADGGISYKFVSPARRSVPDRLDLRPVPPEHRELVARYVRFTECKRPGEKPTPAQQREHDMLRGLGFVVDVVDQRTS
ncbi:MAG: VRR-NUC domain-containing protein [Hydrogenophaga sp.]|nr:VRR-NUC domain-containing protein [Hydrogenophaga sp.]